MTNSDVTFFNRDRTRSHRDVVRQQSRRTSYKEEQLSTIPPPAQISPSSSILSNMSLVSAFPFCVADAYLTNERLDVLFNGTHHHLLLPPNSNSIQSSIGVFPTPSPAHQYSPISSTAYSPFTPLQSCATPLTPHRFASSTYPRF